MLPLMKLPCNTHKHLPLAGTHLSVVFQHLITLLTPNPRLLVAAKRHCMVKHIVCVDPDSPGMQAPGQPVGNMYVLCKHACCQAILAVVGTCQHLRASTSLTSVWQSRPHSWHLSAACKRDIQHQAFKSCTGAGTLVQANSH